MSRQAESFLQTRGPLVMRLEAVDIAAAPVVHSGQPIAFRLDADVLDGDVVVGGVDLLSLVPDVPDVDAAVLIPGQQFDLIGMQSDAIDGTVCH